MADAEFQIQADLTKHAAQELQVVLNRHARLAEHALDSTEMVMLLLNIANGMAMGCILYALQLTKDDVAKPEFYDTMSGHMARLLAVGKPTVLDQFATVQAKATAA